MKVTIARENLIKALQRVSNIVGSKSTMPIMFNTLIEAADGKISFSSTDLEIRITVKIDATVEKPGRTTLPAKKLYSIVSGFRSENVQMDCNENHHTNIKCGTSSILLYGLDPNDFPAESEFTPLRTIKMKQADLSRFIDQVSYAAAADESRKALQGMLVSVKENNFVSVATDGRRLALSEKLIDDFNGSDGDSILPIKGVNELKRVLEKDGDLTIEIGDKQAVFNTGKAIITTKLIEGNYPNFRQVIPAGFKTKIAIPSASFTACLNLMSNIIDSADSGYVKLTFTKGRINFEAISSSTGIGSDYMEIEYEGEDIEVSFRPDFLLEPFKHSDADNLRLEINDGLSPVSIKSDDGFVYIIMPMRNK